MHDIMGLSDDLEPTPANDVSNLSGEFGCKPLSKKRLLR